MAYQKKQKTEQTGSVKTYSEVRNLLLYVFDVKESKSGEWLLIKAKLSSKPVEGAKYGNGISVNLMAKFEDAVIDDDLDEKMWIRVDGNISAEDYKRQGGTGTQLVIRATKIAVSKKE